MNKEKTHQKIKADPKITDMHKLFPEGWKVDKAKIKYLVRNKKQIEDITYCLSIDSRIETSYTSSALNKSNHNYIIQCKKGNVYVGIEDNSNMNMDEARKTVTIEYNPQKVDVFQEVTYLSFLKALDVHRRYILYLDLAFDMHVNISDVRYKKRRKNEYRALHEHDHLETIYLKKLGTPNAVRIYDKTKEMNSNKNEELDTDTGEIQKEIYTGDCTRYEIRIKPEAKNLQLMLNLCDPFLIQDIVKLHSIWFDNGIEEKVLKEIEKYPTTQFKNLLLIHLGYNNKITDKVTRKKYNKLYEDIKNKFLENDPRNQLLKKFNTDNIHITISNYLKSITQSEKLQDNSLLICKILEHQGTVKIL